MKLEVFTIYGHGGVVPCLEQGRHRFFASSQIAGPPDDAQRKPAKLRIREPGADGFDGCGSVSSEAVPEADARLLWLRTRIVE